MGIKYLKVLTIIAVAMMVILSCEDGDDNGDEVTPVPVVTSIDPFAGYPGEEVTITGEDFNAVYSMNLIELDTSGVPFASVSPTAGSETMLTFARPNVSGVGVTIHAWLRVRNLDDLEEKVSDSVAIDLLPIFDIIAVEGLSKTKGGIAFDANGNMYVRGQDPGEVYKITPEGEESYFGQTHWGEGEMTFGPDGYLYAAVVWGDYGLVRIPSTGGDYESYVASTDVPNPFCLGWDDDQNLYIGTAGGEIYRRSAASGEVSELISGLGWGASMRVFENDIYWFTKSDSGNNGLFKAPIPADSDTIAANTIVTVLATEDYTPSGLAIDGLGNIYLMDGWIDKDDYSLTQMLVRVTPAGVVEDVYELPTQNPNKAAWYDNKIYIAAGELDSTVYVLYLGEEYGTGAVPSYRW